MYFIVEYRPSQALEPFIDHYWQGEFNTTAAKSFAQRVVPSGHIDLIIHLNDVRCQFLQETSFFTTPDYLLVGLYSKAFHISFPGLVKVFGITFKPEGIYNLFGVPAVEFQEAFIDLESLNGYPFTDFCNRLRETSNIAFMIHMSEQFFLQQLDKCKLHLYYLNRAAEIIRQKKGMLSMTELAARANISTRQLEREFKQKIGLSPKQYMRLARLKEANRLLDADSSIGFTSISHACGFADQAHFIREFKSFVGEKPTTFLREREKFFI